MMSPTVVLRDGAPELVLGSAGSNRIRSAILQTIIRVIDDGLRGRRRRPGAAGPLRGRRRVRRARDRHRRRSSAPGGRSARFRELNLFFGGVQAVARDRQGRLSGGGDPRRGGAAVVVDAAMRVRAAAVLALLAGASRCPAAASTSQSPDLFLVTRTGGQGQKLTLLVNDARHDRVRRRQAEAAGRSAAAPGARPGHRPQRRRQVQAELPGSASRQRVLLHGESAERHIHISRYRGPSAQGTVPAGVVCSTGRG